MNWKTLLEWMLQTFSIASAVTFMIRIFATYLKQNKLQDYLCQTLIKILFCYFQKKIICVFILALMDVLNSLIASYFPRIIIHFFCLQKAFLRLPVGMNGKRNGHFIFFSDFFLYSYKNLPWKFRLQNLFCSRFCKRMYFLGERGTLTFVTSFPFETLF